MEISKLNFNSIVIDAENVRRECCALLEGCYYQLDASDGKSLLYVCDESEAKSSTIKEVSFSPTNHQEASGFSGWSSNEEPNHTECVRQNEVVEDVQFGLTVYSFFK